MEYVSGMPYLLKRKIHITQETKPWISIPIFLSSIDSRIWKYIFLAKDVIFIFIYSSWFNFLNMGAYLTARISWSCNLKKFLNRQKLIPFYSSESVCKTHYN